MKHFKQVVTSPLFWTCLILTIFIYITSVDIILSNSSLNTFSYIVLLIPTALLFIGILLNNFKGCKKVKKKGKNL